MNAKKILITVSLGILQANDLRFSPEPGEVLQAASRLCFGHVARVILRFRRGWWQEKDDFAGLGFLLSCEKDFPTWWTPLPMLAPFITGWSAGPHAEALLGMSQDEITRRALADLSRIIGTPKTKLGQTLEAVYFHDWHADSLARGAYSYVPVGAMSARATMATPVFETLYFAGEATETKGHSATVHGAIASGRRAAAQILAS